MRYMHMDTVGFGDNRGNISDEHIGELIKNETISNYSYRSFPHISAIVVTESCSSDTNRLAVIFNQLDVIFGFLPVEAIIVAVTKKNILNPTSF